MTTKSNVHFLILVMILFIVSSVKAQTGTVTGDRFDLIHTSFPSSKTGPSISRNWKLDFNPSSASSLQLTLNGTEKMNFSANMVSTSVLFRPASIFSLGTIHTTSNLIAGQNITGLNITASQNIVANQKIGIGTSNPTEELTINGGLGRADGFIVYGSSSTKSNWNAPWYGLSVVDESFLDFRTDASHSSLVTLQGFYGLAFRTDKGMMAMDNDGIVTIGLDENRMELIAAGTDQWNDFKLYVANGIRTEEVKIDVKTNWPDYVFAEGYNLRPLSEVASFIAKNHHLPEVPSAAEVTEDGIMIGEMNVTLLKKIEELTLYVIEQQNQITKLTNEVEQLKK